MHRFLFIPLLFFMFACGTSDYKKDILGEWKAERGEILMNNLVLGELPIQAYMWEFKTDVLIESSLPINGEIQEETFLSDYSINPDSIITTSRTTKEAMRFKYEITNENGNQVLTLTNCDTKGNGIRMYMVKTD